MYDKIFQVPDLCHIDSGTEESFRWREQRWAKGEVKLEKM